jgi:hypothetical protein
MSTTYHPERCGTMDFMSENRFEAVGQVYCGVQPEFVMVAF